MTPPIGQPHVPGTPKHEQEPQYRPLTLPWAGLGGGGLTFRNVHWDTPSDWGDLIKKNRQQQTRGNALHSKA